VDGDMKIKVNERERTVADDATLFGLRDALKPDADVVIFNGAPAAADRPLAAGDEVVLIRRGEIPPAEELEALMASRHTPGVHERLRAAAVGIAGLGGLGSAIAIALARSGVGRLILADFDVIEPSNLNRQQYFVDQIGRPKAEALVENLRRINPYVRCEAHRVRLTRENIPALFGGVDVMVEAFDRADQKVLLVETFTAAFPDTPLVAASGLAGHGDSNALRAHRMGRRLYVIGDLESAAQPGRGLMAPRVGIAAHLQANTVLRLIMGEE
jgi:sulfur carrier protein ThiS adenylyltransferase